MVPLRSDRHLVSGGLVAELTHLGAAETLRAAVSDAVLAVQTEQTVVAAGAVVTLPSLARLQLWTELWNFSCDPCVSF